MEAISRVKWGGEWLWVFLNFLLSLQLCCWAHQDWFMRSQCRHVQVYERKVKFICQKDKLNGLLIKNINSPYTNTLLHLSVPCRRSASQLQLKVVKFLTCRLVRGFGSIGKALQRGGVGWRLLKGLTWRSGDANFLREGLGTSHGKPQVWVESLVHQSHRLDCWVDSDLVPSCLPASSPHGATLAFGSCFRPLETTRGASSCLWVFVMPFPSVS